MQHVNRRTFLSAAAAGIAATPCLGLLSAQGDELTQSAPRERPHILYALSTGCWGPVTPPGMPLPLTKILDETAAGGFNGVRLTGFPEILQHNDMSLDQYGDELAKRGLRFSTVSFGGQYHDPAQHDDIRQRARFALEAHRKHGANAMVFFPPGLAEGAQESAALQDSFAFLDDLGKMAVEEFGVRMGLHNHTNSLIENQQQVDRFLEGTDPRYVFCAWDSAHLLLGGCDVVATYRKSIDRLVYTDFKDATLAPLSEDYVAPNGQRYAGDSHAGKFYNSMLELGRGQIDFPVLMRMLAKADYRGWVNHDLDTIRVSPLESWRISMNYITRELDPIYQ